MLVWTCILFRVLIISFTYRLGLIVAHHPWLTIVITFGICGICGIGMQHFKETKEDAKLWVPKSSRVLPEKKWVDETFPEETRFTTMIVTAPNILTPWMINAVRLHILYSS